MKNIYKQLYQHKKLSLDNNCRVKIMLRLADGLDLHQKNILDIGCYDGTFLSLIQKSYPNNKFYGVEASNYGVKEVIKKGFTVKHFYFNDVNKIPFKGQFFDLVIAGEIIEHIYDTDFFLNEIHRLLKKGGYLLISTPNIASFGRRLMLLLGINPIIEVSPNESNSSGHIRYFTFQTLEKLLSKHGFKVVSKQSDVVNLSPTGKYKSKLLAKLLPSMGQSLIFLLVNN